MYSRKNLLSNFCVSYFAQSTALNSTRCYLLNECAFSSQSHKHCGRASTISTLYTHRNAKYKASNESQQSKQIIKMRYGVKWAAKSANQSVDAVDTWRAITEPRHELSNFAILSLCLSFSCSLRDYWRIGSQNFCHMSKRTGRSS